jgi:sulfur relay (sulfurtransferase) DsrC/TusE family protein
MSDDWGNKFFESLNKQKDTKMSNNDLELIKSFDLITHFPDFEVSAGIYKIDNECECFILEVIDLKHDKKRYVQRFNSEWCPPEVQQWLVTVLMINMVDIIKDCRSFYTKQVSDAFNNFITKLKTY